MLIASDAADQAHLAALGPRGASHPDPERAVDIGARRFVETMTADALAERADIGESAPAATLDERVAALPEPWRARTRNELERLKARIAKTVGRDRPGPR